MDVIKKRGTSERRTLSLSEELDAEVDRQVEAGVADSRTDWFEQAGWLLIEMQRLGIESLDAEALAARDEPMPQMTLEVGGDD